MGMNMWFGTEERMRWIPVPQTGADMSAQAFSASGTLMGGGGYVADSMGTHRNYAWSWSNASAPSMAALMLAYKQGTYGDGLVYFHNPHHYLGNILPAHWADPSRARNDEMPRLIRSREVSLRFGLAAGGDRHNLPIRTTTYDLTPQPIGYPGRQDSLFIPVPPGMDLLIGAIYTRTGTGGVFAAPVDVPGDAGTPTRLPSMSANGAVLLSSMAVQPGALGVRLWVGKEASGASSVTITAMIARLVPSVINSAQALRGPWVPGQGHSGARFIGAPTEVAYNGVGGGQVGFAATLKEVGSWEY